MEIHPQMHLLCLPAARELCSSGELKWKLIFFRLDVARELWRPSIGRSDQKLQLYFTRIRKNDLNYAAAPSYLLDHRSISVAHY